MWIYRKRGDDVFIGENIKYLRLKHGYSQEEMANILGYKSYTTITKWESGVSEPTLKMANQIADFFKISVNELCYTRLGLVPEEPPAAPPENFPLSNIEKKIITGYRKADAITQAMVLRALSIDEPAAPQRKEGLLA